MVHRATWEFVHRAMDAARPHAAADAELLIYLRGKTLGYDGRGRLMREFALE